MMKALWQRIRKLLRSSGHSPRGRSYDLATFQFPPIDLDKAAETLQLKEKAVSNGLSELPPRDSSQLDGPQQAIIQFVKGEVADISTAFETKITGLNQQITRRDVRQLVNSVSHVDEQLDHELLSIRDELQPQLVRAKDELEAAERDFRGFRAANALDREPEYPDGHFLHAAAVVGVLAGEAVMNAIFFERGSAQGFVGGAVWALVLATIDVIIVVALGFAGAWATSSSPAFKAWGRLALATFVAWAGLYNLLVAHIREALQVDPGRAMQLAEETFRGNMFGLAQADSWILLAFGLFFSIVGMFSGFNWTDRFPGYARRHQKLLLLRRQVEHLEAELIARSTEARDRAVQKLADAILDCRNSLISMGNDISGKKLLLTNGRTFVKYQEDTCNALIAVYRDENQKSRKTEPPKYFNRKWELPIPPTFTDDTDRDVELMEECRIALSNLEGRSEAIHQAVRERYDRFREQHTPGYLGR